MLNVCCLVGVYVRMGVHLCEGEACEHDGAWVYSGTRYTCMDVVQMHRGSVSTASSVFNV